MSKKEAKTEKLECIWLMGTPCRNTDELLDKGFAADDIQVKEVEMFNHQIKIPICPGHLEEHMHVMALHKNGYDVEDILNMTADDRKREFLQLKLGGLLEEEVEL